MSTTAPAFATVGIELTDKRQENQTGLQLIYEVRAWSGDILTEYDSTRRDSRNRIQKISSPEWIPRIEAGVEGSVRGTRGPVVTHRDEEGLDERRLTGATVFDFDLNARRLVTWTWTKSRDRMVRPDSPSKSSTRRKPSLARPSPWCVFDIRAREGAHGGRSTTSFRFARFDLI